MQRHLFPGGNTAVGFFSFYHDILPFRQARRMIILKGGPGVGKSTFMRRIGALLEERGRMVEYPHCSSDPQSLDGVVCRGIGFAMLDGTAPHIVDPEIPGAADSILNLGVYLDEEALTGEQADIAALQREISACFAQAYRCLAAALPLREDSAAILRDATDEGALVSAWEPWLQTLTAFRTPSAPGRSRSMFASAITPEGCVHYLQTLALPRLWRVRGQWADGAHRLLSLLRHAALLHGLDVEALFCPMQPDRIEHLVVPALGLMVTTDNRYHALEQEAEREIDFDAVRRRGLTPSEQEALAFNAAQFDLLLARACSCIARAKGLHDELEQFYIRRMDFDGVERCWQEVAARISAMTT